MHAVPTFLKNAFLHAEKPFPCEITHSQTPFSFNTNILIFLKSHSIFLFSETMKPYLFWTKFACSNKNPQLYNRSLNMNSQKEQFALNG